MSDNSVEFVNKRSSSEQEIVNKKGVIQLFSEQSEKELVDILTLELKKQLNSQIVESSLDLSTQISCQYNSDCFLQQHCSDSIKQDNFPNPQHIYLKRQIEVMKKKYLKQNTIWISNQKKDIYRLRQFPVRTFKNLTVGISHIRENSSSILVLGKIGQQANESWETQLNESTIKKTIIFSNDRKSIFPTLKMKRCQVYSYSMLIQQLKAQYNDFQHVCVPNFIKVPQLKLNNVISIYSYIKKKICLASIQQIGQHQLAFQDFKHFCIEMKYQLGIIFESPQQEQLFFLKEDFLNNPISMLMMYKRQGFFYRFINRMLKVVTHIFQINWIRYPINQIRQAIKQKQMYSHDIEYVYRGCFLHKKNQLQKLKVGEKIQFLSFLSTSTSLKIAKTYINNCLIKIKLPVGIKGQGFCSLFQNDMEKEVLFNLQNYFLVTEIQCDYKPYFLQLQLINISECQRLFYKKELDQGEALVQISKYDSLKFYKKKLKVLEQKSAKCESIQNTQQLIYCLQQDSCEQVDAQSQFGYFRKAFSQISSLYKQLQFVRESKQLSPFKHSSIQYLLDKHIPNTLLFDLLLYELKTSKQKGIDQLHSHLTMLTIINQCNRACIFLQIQDKWDFKYKITQPTSSLLEETFLLQWQALYLYKRSNFKSALRILKRVIKKQRQIVGHVSILSLTSLFISGKCCIYLQQIQQGEIYFREALQLQMNYTIFDQQKRRKLHLQLGMVQNCKGNYVSAIIQYQKAKLNQDFSFFIDIYFIFSIYKTIYQRNLELIFIVKQEYLNMNIFVHDKIKNKNFLPIVLDDNWYRWLYCFYKNKDPNKSQIFKKLLQQKNLSVCNIVQCQQNNYLLYFKKVIQNMIIRIRIIESQAIDQDLIIDMILGSCQLSIILFNVSFIQLYIIWKYNYPQILTILHQKFILKNQRQLARYFVEKAIITYYQLRTQAFQKKTFRQSNIDFIKQSTWLLDEKSELQKVIQLYLRSGLINIVQLKSLFKISFNFQKNWYQFYFQLEI